MITDDERFELRRLQTAVGYLSCPHYIGEGICDMGCYQEPVCQTGGPWEEEALEAASALVNLKASLGG